MAREQSWGCHLDMYPSGLMNWDPCVAGSTAPQSLGPGLGGEPSIIALHVAGKPRDIPTGQELPGISEETGQHQCSSGHSRETPKATAWQKRAPPQPAAPASWAEAGLKWKCLEGRTPDLGNSPKSLPSVATFQEPTPSGLTSLPGITPSCPTHSRFSCVTSNLDPLWGCQSNRLRSDS